MANTPYGKQRINETLKIRNPASRTSPMDCGRAGGYKLADIREYYEMQAELTTGRLLEQGIERLLGHSEAPQLDAELLLAHVLNIGRARLKSHPEHVQNAADAQHYAALLDRRATGEPLAYIVGYKEFWSLKLASTPAALVPRPETELLVERALELRPMASANAVDLGTGTGAIALALASERPHWHLVATDASLTALDLARRNAAALNIRNVEFLEGSWFEPLRERRFDLIASNPPYVADDDAALLQPALRFEPRTALTPGGDALADLRAIIHQAPPHLERGGWLLLEHGAQQADDVARELVVRGFRHVRSHRDLAGHERMTEAQWAE
jgi:release factor glutamine methyltransferase